MSGQKLAAARKPGPARHRSSWYTGFRWGGVSQIVKTAQSRGRTERTLLSAGARAGAPRPAPRQAGAQRDRRNAADRFDPSLLLSHYCLLHYLITPTSCQWLAAVAGKRTDARPSRAVAKIRADVWNSCFQGSPIFGLCPEREGIILVTIGRSVSSSSRQEVIVDVVTTSVQKITCRLVPTHSGENQDRKKIRPDRNGPLFRGT